MLRIENQPGMSKLRLHATRLRTSLSTAPATTPVNRNVSARQSRQSQKVSFPFPTPHHCRPRRGSPKPHPRWWISLRPRKLLCCRSGGLNCREHLRDREESLGKTGKSLCLTTVRLIPSGHSLTGLSLEKPRKSCPKPFVHLGVTPEEDVHGSGQETLAERKPQRKPLFSRHSRSPHASHPTLHAMTQP